MSQTTDKSNSEIIPPSNTTIVRLANSGDAEQIANLHAISWQSAYRGMLNDDYLANHAVSTRLTVWRERFLPENQHRYITLLAQQNEALVGFICIVLDADDTWGQLIDNLHIHPDFKGGGIGRMLMRSAAELIAEKRPNSPIHLIVYEENTAAQSFYNALGGEVVERIVEVRGDGQSGYSLKYGWQNLTHLIKDAK